MQAPKYASDFPVGQVLRDHTDSASGLRLLVVRSNFSFCAYVGVQADHALSSLEELNFRCHHGVSFQSWGRAGSTYPEGWYWWGWDYAHFTDVLELPVKSPEEQESSQKINEVFQDIHKELFEIFGVEPEVIHQKRWTLDEVFEDALDVLMDLRTALQHSGEELSALLPRLNVAASSKPRP